jgi:hypothetical protein
MRVNIMTKFRVTIASTIYYQAEIEANNESEINDMFDNQELDFTTWREIDLDSSIESIYKIKED